MSVAAVQNVEDDGNTLPKTFGEGTENTVTISADADNKTLTISGKGDLTKVGSGSYTFTSAAQNTVFQKGENDTYTSVNANAAYNSASTYATRTANYTQIDDFANTYTQKKTHYYFTNDGAAKYFTKKQTGYDQTTGNIYGYEAVASGTEVEQNNSAWVAGETSQNAGTKYFTRSGEDGNYTYTRVTDYTSITTTSGDVTSLEKVHLNLGDAKDIVYYYSNGKYTKAENDAEYNSSLTYYKQSWTYADITLEQLVGNAYVSGTSDFISALWANQTYETVKFVNQDSSNPLYIDNDIVKAVLYSVTKTDEYNTQKSANKTITTLDLGEATCKNFSTKTFEKIEGLYELPVNLANVTLPQATDKKVPYMVLESIRHKNGAAIVKNVVIPEGYTAVSDSAFIDMDKAETVKLANSITTIGKSAFRQTGFKSIELPTSLTTIGDDAFNSCKSLAHVTFPESLKTIGKGAFAQCEKLDSINLNQGIEIIGNSAFYLSAKNDNVKVLQIPNSVKYIGPAAFNFRWYADVYYYGDKAPISPYGISYISSDVTSAAFGSQLLCGNNGFSPLAGEQNSTAGDISTGYANRENYMNGGTYIAVLHFRSDIDKDNEKGEEPNAETFTDITRKYERWLTEKKTYDGQSTGEYYWYSQDHKTVGKETEAPMFGGFGPGDKQVVTPGFEDTELGSQFIWPSQMQFIRSYAVNSNGYKWDGVTPYLPDLTDEEIQMIKDQETGVPGTTLANASNDDLKKVAYHGTRQFVLVSRDVKGPNPDYPVPATSGERWWTLCVPCDVTKAQVNEVFGEGTHLCLFSKVERTIDTEKGNTLHLYFQNDTYVNHYTRNVNGTWTKGEAVSDDNDIVLYAHTPYMIYPTKRLDDGKQYILSNYTLQAGDVRMTVVDANEGKSTDDIKYEFTGTYRSKITTTTTDEEGNTTTTSSPVHIPQYTYVFGKKNNANSQFWFYTGTNGTWVANKCLVERYDANGKNDLDTFFGGNDKTSGAKQISTFGEDEATAIDRVVYHYGDESTDAPIYNLGGQLVRQNGDQSGLAKGIYVQNGKKFVVK